MIPWIFLCVCQAGAIALTAAAVRLQRALLGGYDLVVGASVLVAAELALAVFARSPFGPLVSIMAACTVAWGALLFFVYVWNIFNLHVRWPRSSRGAAVFLASLGVSSIATGATGLLRGPGALSPKIVLPAASIGGDVVAGPTLFGILIAFVAIGALLAWQRTVSGWSIKLVQQDSDFAEELGIELNRLALPVSVATAGLTAASGVYFAAANGSNPEIGGPAFLFGVGAAFLFPERGLGGLIAGATIFGLIFVSAQVFLSPSVASTILFGATLVVVVWRGTPRIEQGTR